MYCKIPHIGYNYKKKYKIVEENEKMSDYIIDDKINVFTPLINVF